MDGGFITVPLDDYILPGHRILTNSPNFSLKPKIDLSGQFINIYVALEWWLFIGFKYTLGRAANCSS